VDDSGKSSGEQWLGPLVPDLPPFKPIINDLKQKIFDIFQKWS